MKPTLVILAAGMGSRYGSLKQLDGIGPNNETIIDYLVYDAIQAGFGTAIFVIRETFAKEFCEKITQKFSDKVIVDIAFQAVNTPIDGIDKLPERSKPWGTAHALLVARDKISTPFAVANADDFYGRNAINTLGAFLRTKVSPDNYAMVGYELAKTLSDHGSVSRGICMVNEHDHLISVIERTKIERADEKIYFFEEEKKEELSADCLVSMNLWGFHPSIFDYLQSQFIDFAKSTIGQPKAEFYIPLVANKLIQEKTVAIKMLPTSSDWFGVTYKEDKPILQTAVREMIATGMYPEVLWE